MAPTCSIQITFDGQKRRYVGGDAVRGSVRVVVNEQIKSRGIVLTHCWRAHGIGNPHEEKLETIRLAEADLLSPGEELLYDFQVTTPLQPLTQRGSLFSVDYYIRVHVDVPWASDPNAEEDYLLEVGGVPDEPNVSRRRADLQPGWVMRGQRNSPAGQMVGCIVVTVLIAFGIGFAFAMPLIAVAIALLGPGVGAWFVIRGMALRHKLGAVELCIPHHRVAPGEPWLAELKFQPPRHCRINGITLTLEACESAVSGSGSDRKTHRRTVFEQTIPLREAEELAAAEPVHERLLMNFPETTAYSFEAGDNAVRWTAAVRIDIPGFPDWTASTPLQVIRPQFAGRLNTEPELLSHWKTSPAGEIQQRDLSTALTPDDSSGPKTIATVLAELNQHSTHSTARGSVIRRTAGYRMPVSITISRSASTIGPAEDDPLYAGGVTIDGTIDGTRQAIRIVALASASPELAALPDDASWLAEVELIEWDTIYHRINARQLP